MIPPVNAINILFHASEHKGRTVTFFLHVAFFLFL